MPGTSPGAHAPYTPSWTDAEEESEGGIKIGQVLDLIWSNKMLLLAAALVGAAYATWSFYKRTPVYTARSSIVIEMQEQHVLNFQSVVPRASHSFFEMETELLELRSHDLMARVVETLDLGNDPEFNPALRYPISAWQEKIGYYRILSGLGLVNPIAPQATEPQWLQDFSDNVNVVMSRFGMGEKPVPAMPHPDQADKNALAILYSKVFVTRIADTYAFQVTAVSQLPETAEAIANKIADLYVGRKREIDFQAVDEAMQWLSDRISEQKEDLERTERAVETLITDTGLASEDIMLTNAQRLKGMRERQEDRLESVSEMTRRLARIEALRSAGDFESLAAEIEAPRLRSHALELSKNPGDDDLRERADLLLDALVAKIATQRDDAEIQAALLAEPIAELDALVESQGGDLVKLRQLRREAEAARIVYEYSLRRMREIAVQQGVRQREVRVASRASKPGAPSRGNAVTAITQGAAMGFGASIALLFLIQLMRNTIRSSDQLEAMSGQPVIGVVPEHGTARPRALLDLAVDKPGSALIEAVRNLRSAIRLSNVDTTPTVIAVTSSLPDEGKSVLASLLSATAAGAGKRVLLIDTDLRRKVLREYFRSSHQPGLIGLLSGENSLEDVIHRDEQTGVDLILADSGQVNPADLFESRKFEQLITELREEYDLIVLDTPPVLVVPDTRILCQYADAIIYCVRWNSTRKKMVEAGLNLLRQVQLQITGFALTRIDPKRMSHYGYYGYGSGRKKMNRYYAN